MQTGPRQQQHEVSNLRLWLSAFAPVLAWALHVSVSYAFVELYCQQLATMGDRAALAILSLFTAAMLLLAIAGCVRCYQNRRAICLAPENQRRGLFVATSGLLLGIFMVASILMQTLPLLVVPPCM